MQKKLFAEIVQLNRAYINNLVPLYEIQKTHKRNKIQIYMNRGEVNIPDMPKSSKHSEKSSDSISNSAFSDKVKNISDQLHKRISSG